MSIVKSITQGDQKEFPGRQSERKDDDTRRSFRTMHPGLIRRVLRRPLARRAIRRGRAATVLRLLTLDVPQSVTRAGRQLKPEDHYGGDASPAKAPRAPPPKTIPANTTPARPPRQGTSAVNSFTGGPLQHCLAGSG